MSRSSSSPALLGAVRFAAAALLILGLVVPAGMVCPAMAAPAPFDDHPGCGCCDTESGCACMGEDDPAPEMPLAPPVERSELRTDAAALGEVPEASPEAKAAEAPVAAVPNTLHGKAPPLFLSNCTFLC